LVSSKPNENDVFFCGNSRRKGEVDLSQFAGREVNLELNTTAESWGPEGCAYWTEIGIVSK